MPNSNNITYGSWIKAPIHSKLGTITLAGALLDIPGINTNSMRVLGSYAIVFIRSGNGFYSDSNGTQCRFSAGDVITISPELAHAYGPQDSTPWEQIYVVFNGPQFDLLMQSGVLSETKPVWHLQPVEYWQRRIEETLPIGSQATQSESIRTIGRFTQLLTDMAATDSEAKRLPYQEWFSQSINLLSEPSKDGWLRPQEVAQRVGLNYENFRKLFTKHAQESPGQFQKRRRIEHASAAIYQRSQTLQELADEHGFCDVFHFSKVFSQVMGESPSEYRKRVTGH